MDTKEQQFDNEALKKIEMFAERALTEWAEEDVAMLTPERTDNYLSFLSGYSALLEERFARLKQAEGKVWMECKEEAKSIKEADMMFDQTEVGQALIETKHMIKASDKVIRACRDRLQRFTNERFNSKYGG